MEKIKRYRCYEVDSGGLDYNDRHETDDNGEWIKYTDYIADIAKLEAEHKKLRDALIRIINNERLGGNVNSLISQIAKQALKEV